MMSTPRTTAAAAAAALFILTLTAVDAKSCEQYEAATVSVLTKVIWPTSRDIAVSGVAPSEFDANANGRVVPAGTFSTSLGALEYFYRLAGPLDRNDTSSNRVSGFDVRWMVCDNQKQQVAFECIFHLTNPSTPAKASNISAMGVFTFNKDGKVCAYDWDLRRLGLVVEANTKATVDSLFGGNMDAYNNVIKAQICNVAMSLCTGPNQQYSSNAECISFLNTLPVGDWDRADQANVVCRSLHALLVPVPPAVHCPHIGPTGGGKCVDHPITLLYTEDFSTCAA